MKTIEFLKQVMQECLALWIVLAAVVYFVWEFLNWI